MTTVFRRRRERQGTTAALAGDVLLQGEWGLDTQTREVKIGNGTTPWSSLPALGSGVGDLPIVALGGSGTQNIALDAWNTLTTTGTTTLANPTVPADNRVHVSVIEITNAGTHTLNLPAWHWDMATPPSGLTGRTVLFLQQRSGATAMAFVAATGMA